MWVFHSILIINNYPKVFGAGCKRHSLVPAHQKSRPPSSPNPGGPFWEREGTESLWALFYEMNTFMGHCVNSIFLLMNQKNEQDPSSKSFDTANSLHINTQLLTSQRTQIRNPHRATDSEVLTYAANCSKQLGDISATVCSMQKNSKTKIKAVLAFYFNQFCQQVGL